eukprot:CAMPEP_0172810476 /NCGR_PEP_ID=MMETSP1075-20121228/8828_1 /TAXON_ID=2916 /ORGANISM="Ceratium fusus, Strain PA161109" /LENGTH=60 /DNA_ID=CAMNT_0013649795 /DNA_START=309 /DNA_END=492 /DNA_ORIENTATION=+
MGVAPPIVAAATHEHTLRFVSKEVLLDHALDVPGYPMYMAKQELARLQADDLHQLHGLLV